MSRLVVTVYHLPAPQGSKRHVGGGRMAEMSKAVGPFRDAVTAAALPAIAAAQRGAHAHPEGYLRGPVALTAVFTLPRPQGHYGTGRNAGQLRPTAPTAPAGKPDLDKLLRALLDGLTDAGAITDDSRVVTLTAAKTYPGGHLDALDTPGVVATISTVVERQDDQ